MLFCILTGDIVESTALDPAVLDEIMEDLDRAAQMIGAWRGGGCSFARRGGDGWQMALTDTQFDLRAALFVQARVKRLHKAALSRIAIAVDQAALAPGQDPNSGHGPAFVRSGRLLDAMSGQVFMAHASSGSKAAALALASHIAQGWTQAQARAMAEMLVPDPGPRAKAAKRLGISRQAVDQALWSAGFLAIEDALAQWELV